MSFEGMSFEEWDRRYAAKGYLYGVEPNAFLMRQRHRLNRGMRVLAVGDGEGRNGVWLAQQGMRVASVDGSARAVQKALRLALDRGVTLQAQCADLRTWDWPRAYFDAVVSIFLHFAPDTRPAMHRAMLDALTPGGLVILEAFRPEQRGKPSGGPPDPDLYYDAAMLRADFAGADILDLNESDAPLDEGPRHQGPAATVQLVARKPPGSQGRASTYE